MGKKRNRKGVPPYPQPFSLSPTSRTLFTDKSRRCCGGVGVFHRGIGEPIISSSSTEQTNRFNTNLGGSLYRSGAFGTAQNDHKTTTVCDNL